MASHSRGFHLITGEIERALPEVSDLSIGILHLFIQHTSASLTINENADPTVRQDLESHFNQFVPEGAPYYRHVRHEALIYPQLKVLPEKWRPTTL
jgi:secondary thiamine-phosphate synthase enzyme